jgi:hypothetical protein
MDMAINPNPILGGPWRIVLLDRDPADPKWLLATVTIPADVRPAVLDLAGRYAGWKRTCDWVHDLTGQPVSLVPVADALAWHVIRPR